MGSVQGVSLPVRVVEATTASSLLREVADIRAQVDRIEATRSADLDPLEQLQRKVASRQGVPFVRSPTPEQYALQRDAQTRYQLTSRITRPGQTHNGDRHAGPPSTRRTGLSACQYLHEDHPHIMHDSVLTTVRQNDLICASKVIIAKELSPPVVSRGLRVLARLR